MRTRFAGHWSHSPGCLDPLHMETLFPSSNAWGIPDLPRNDAVPTAFVPWGRPASLNTAPPGAAIHFWLDDYRFERVWNRPLRHLPTLSTVGAAVTPDFSVFTDWPLASVVWQTYRARWLGALWHLNGITVIPSVTWSGTDSYPFVFAGIARGSVVAVQTQCIPRADPDAHLGFLSGFHAMLDAIQPPTVLLYGKRSRIPGFPMDVPVLEYPTFFDSRRPALARTGG